MEKQKQTRTPTEAEVRGLFCRHMQTPGKDRMIGYIPNFDQDFRVEIVELLKEGRAYGHKVGMGDTFFNNWSSKAEKNRQADYLCSITKKPCIARRVEPNNASVSQYRAYQSRVALTTQQECPCYQLPQDLSDKVKEFNEKRVP